MIIYNLFPRLAGPMSKWDDHIVRAAEMGFDWLYINPLQQTGSSGSLYSIADYFSVNPAFLDGDGSGSADEQVRAMTARAHKAGLKIMTDLVINHCAVDSALTREHPEWFKREADGRVANASCDHNGERVVWQDLAQFDHEHTRDREGLYRYCLRVVEHLLALGFDGFRCDAAYQVPHALWHRLLHEIKGRGQHTVFVAETLGCTADQTKETARAGFDAVFNSSKWWNFHDWWLIEQYNLIRETAPSISFPESHDTPRLCAELNGNVAGLKQRYLFAALFSAGVMLPIGYEFGFRKSLHVVNTTPADWETTDIALAPFIQQVNVLKKCFVVFREESPLSILPANNPNVLLLWKASAKHHDEALLILNKDPWNQQEFYADNLRHFIQSGKPLEDVSPELQLEYIPQPFHYMLRPGQGIVLVTSRK
jgi:starch synthase (maltosyl-transferring)